MFQDGILKKLDAYRYKKRVARSVSSGIKPLSLRYCQVNSCENNLPVAYRTTTVINSTVMGRLTPKEYSYATESTSTCIRIAEWSVCEAMRHITRFVEEGRNIRWVSVRCPARLASEVDMYRWMKRLIKDNGFKYPHKLCLEFPVTLLRERKTSEVRLSVLDMKLLGVKTMLTGCAGDDCPTSRLVAIPVDMVMLAPPATRLAGNRNKLNVVPALVGYLRSMRAEVYAEGAQNDLQINALSRSDCSGYIASAKYSGKAKEIERNMSFAKALAQKETEEDNFDV